MDVVYADLDGTLLGPGGSLFAGEGNRASLRSSAALVELHDADIELVVMSGRTKRSAEVARAFGASAYIAELGGLLIEWPGDGPEEVVENFGDFPGDGSPAEVIKASGAAALLLEGFPRKLIPVAPWAEVSVLFQGHVATDEAEDLLETAGFGWLSFADNGRLRRTYEDLDVSEVHAYHLLPRGVTKASAVRLHQGRHGVEPSRTAAVGDSPADLIVAGEVGAFFLVANGLEQLPTGTHLPGNASVTSAARGDGFAEAVEAILAE